LNHLGLKRVQIKVSVVYTGLRRAGGRSQLMASEAVVRSAGASPIDPRSGRTEATRSTTPRLAQHANQPTRRHGGWGQDAKSMPHSSPAAPWRQQAPACRLFSERLSPTSRLFRGFCMLLQQPASTYNSSESLLGIKSSNKGPLTSEQMCSDCTKE
jgi:hypothetical protein